MDNLRKQVRKTADWAKRRWKLLLLIVEIIVLVFAALSYWRKVSGLAHYEFNEEQISQYDTGEYDACFGGTIDESRVSGLYDVIPQEEMFLRKGYYQYTIYYESDSEGSFCWPHTYVDFYDVIEQSVTYLQNGIHEETKRFWLNADLNVALRIFYDGTGTVKVTGFVLDETQSEANIRLFFIVIMLLVVNIVLGVAVYIRKHEITAQKKYVFAGLTALSVIASYPFLLEYVPEGHDLFFHLVRIEGIKDGLLSGQFPVRINPTFCNGYGYANPVFYGDILLYIPAILRLVGFQVAACYNVFGVLINLLTSFGSYYCFQKMFRKREVAFASTLLYVLAPYRLVDLYIRSAVGEYCAFLFLPFVVYGMFRIYTEDTGKKQYQWCFWPLVLGLSGIIQSHVITGEMTGGLILLTCVMLLSLTFQKKRLWALVKTALFTAALNAWFLVPFVDYALTENVRVIQEGELRMIQKSGLLLPQLIGLFSGYSMNGRDGQEGMAGEMPLYLGLSLVLGMVLCATMLCVMKLEENKRKKQAFFFLLLSVLTAWMVTVYFPWDRISVMFPKMPFVRTLVSNLQFAWRLLAPAVMLAVVTTGFGLLFLYNKEGKGAFVTAAVVLCLLTGIGSMDMMHQYVFYGKNADRRDLMNENTMNAISGAEYELVGADYSVMTEIFEPRAYGEIEISNYTKNGTSISMYVENGGTEGYVLLPLQAYKGYSVTSEGNSITNRNLSRGEGAVVRVDIPAGYSGKVSVRYAGFWYWRVAEAVTVITILYLVWIVLKHKKKPAVVAVEDCR